MVTNKSKYIFSLSSIFFNPFFFKKKAKIDRNMLLSSIKTRVLSIMYKRNDNNFFYVEVT